MKYLAVIMMAIIMVMFAGYFEDEKTAREVAVATLNSTMEWRLSECGAADLQQQLNEFARAGWTISNVEAVGWEVTSRSGGSLSKALVLWRAVTIWQIRACRERRDEPGEEAQ